MTMHNRPLLFVWVRFHGPPRIIETRVQCVQAHVRLQ
jgi:hypothetical protein